MYTPSDLEPRKFTPQVEYKFYSTHAGGHDISHLPKVLDELEAILVDIRFAPSTQPLKWNKDYLKLLLKNRYLHIPALGARTSQNVIALTKPSIQNLSLGLKILKDLKANVLLFCACQSNDTCHRHFIRSEFATRYQKQIYEINDWSNPKNYSLSGSSNYIPVE